MKEYSSRREIGKRIQCHTDNINNKIYCNNRKMFFGTCVPVNIFSIQNISWYWVKCCFSILHVLHHAQWTQEIYRHGHRHIYIYKHINICIDCLTKKGEIMNIHYAGSTIKWNKLIEQKKKNAEWITIKEYTETRFETMCVSTKDRMCT